MSFKYENVSANIHFDTIERLPSALNYGKKPKYVKLSSKVDLYNSSHVLPQIEDTQNVHPEKVQLTQSDGVDDIELDDIDIDQNKKHSDENIIDDDESDEHPKTKKFGTFDGVLGRCLLCMWGVIMFLRTGWIVGNAGVWQATLVMILSASITMFTTLSLSAICTNGEISHGGPYFLISRSLGPQYGGVIGLLFAIGNCVGVALHLVGFSEAIVSLYYPKSYFGGWDIQFISEIGLVLLFFIALKGVGYIIKFNLLLLFLMIVSILVFFIGTFIMTDKKMQYGFTGYSSKTFADNWNPSYLPGYNFISMVAIFFPSVTGCMAGANISGDLKKPSVNIPIGTIVAVIISMTVYVMIAWMLGGCVVRELLDENGNYIINAGLYWNYVIMSDISLFRPLVDIGIYASTFSSATSCFVAAPRIFKAVCDDGLFPIFSFFAVGRKKDNEPIRCYILVLIICALVMLSGDINFIAPLVTNFFLITYALVNYSVFAWDISKSPGWRPSFKYYSPYLSLFATLQSIVLMFLIEWQMALITVIAGVICYIYIGYRDVDVDWGTVVESSLYQKGCKIALKYQKMNTEHAKITRPTFLIMLYENNQNDVDLLFNLTKYLNYSRGLIFIGNVIIGSLNNEDIAREYAAKRKYLYKDYNLNEKILEKCIMETIIADNYENGTKQLLQTAGMGGMKPNVFMIKIDEDISNLKLTNRTLIPSSPRSPRRSPAGNSNSNDDNTNNNHNNIPLWFINVQNALLTGLGIIMIPSHFNLNILDDDIAIDDEEKKKNTLDVWWLFDDGGLTILIAHLLSKHKKFKNSKLRIMALDQIGFEDHTEMVYLMNKLRINAEIEHVKTEDVEDEKHEEEDEKENDDNDDDDDTEPSPISLDNSYAGKRRKISEFANKKIIKYRAVGKTIEKYSKNAKLCLISMPYPRKKFEWWEYSHIIHDLTPRNDINTMFIRGSSEQVLTFCF